MSAAGSRGWSTPVAREDLAEVPCAGDLPMRVHRLVAPLFAELIRLMEAGTHPGFMTSSGGYTFRAKRKMELKWAQTKDPRYLSEHAYGLAGDFRAGTNLGYASRATDIPPKLARESASLCGLSWAGDWTNPYDPMHWEFLGTPDEARAWTVRIAARRVRENIMGWNDDQIRTVVSAAECILRTFDVKRPSLVDPKTTFWSPEFWQFADKNSNQAVKNTDELLRRIPPK